MGIKATRLMTAVITYFQVNKFKQFQSVNGLQIMFSLVVADGFWSCIFIPAFSE